MISEKTTNLNIYTPNREHQNTWGRTNSMSKRNRQIHYIFEVFHISLLVTDRSKTDQNVWNLGLRILSTAQNKRTSVDSRHGNVIVSESFESYPNHLYSGPSCLSFILLNMCWTSFICHFLLMEVFLPGNIFLS